MVIIRSTSKVCLSVFTAVCFSISSNGSNRRSMAEAGLRGLRYASAPYLSTCNAECHFRITSKPSLRLPEHISYVDMSSILLQINARF